jgi:hypothetical protein
MAAPPCLQCGDPYATGVYCAPEAPAPGCDGSDGPHWHWQCTRCPGTWVALSDMGEPEPDPDPTLH